MTLNPHTCRRPGRSDGVWFPPLTMQGDDAGSSGTLNCVVMGNRRQYSFIGCCQREDILMLMTAVLSVVVKHSLELQVVKEIHTGWPSCSMWAH